MKKILLSLLMFVCFLIKANAQIIIGTGTIPSGSPFSVHFGYGRYASLITQAEIGTTGTITQLAWYVATPQPTMEPVKIYLKSTPSTSISSITWSSITSGATLVYDDTIAFSTTGWYTIDITDFTYSSNNLLVLCETNYGGTGNPVSPEFYCTTGATNMGRQWTSDYSPPTNNGTLSNWRPNMNITIPSVVLPNCVISQSPANSSTNVARNQVLTWADGGGGPTSYDIYFGNVTNPPFIANISSLSTTYNPGILMPFTNYYWKIVAKNANGDAINCSTYSFTTGEDFNYCASGPSYTNDEEIYSVTINGNTNSSTCTTVAPGPGSILNRYSNFTTIGPINSAMQGSTVNFSVVEDNCDGIPYYTNACGIWIDYNQDGDFLDANEEVYKENALVQGPRTISGNFIVPLTALPGNTRMRVTVTETWVGSILTSCLSYYYGETEDYKINISQLVTPQITLNPISLNLGYAGANDTSAVKTYQISAANLSPAPGNITITAPSGFEVSLAPASGFSSTVYLPYLSSSLAPTTVYVRFLPTGSPANYSGNITHAGGGASSNIPVSGTSILSLCSSNLGGGICPGDIIKVSFNSLHNTNHTLCNNFNSSTYACYPDTGTFTTSVLKGSTYKLVVKTSIQDKVGVWIDYNHNWVFESSEYFQVYAYGLADSINITIPFTALTGPTWVRVRSVNYPTTLGAGDACSNFPTGMCEDYRINVNPSLVCSVPANIVAGNITTTSAHIDWQETATSTEWQIEYGFQGFTAGTGTKMVINSKPVTLNNLAPASVYSIHVRSICQPGDTSAWATMANFTTVCDIAAIPYFENFDLVTPPALPLCLTISNDNSDSYFWKTQTTNAYSPPNCATIWCNSTLGTNDWLFTPKFNLVAGKAYHLEFHYKNDGTSNMFEKLEVKWGPAANSSGMLNGPVFNDAYVVNSYHIGNAVIVPQISGNYYIGFHDYSNTHGYFLTLDDISIYDSPNSDVSVSQKNIVTCDTLGWYHPQLTFKNTGLDTLKTGDSILCTYTMNSGTPISEFFVATGNIIPGDSAAHVFSSQVRLNDFISYNFTYSVNWIKDFIPNNNSKDFTITINFCTDISEVSPPSINLFPNPSNGIITILMNNIYGNVNLSLTSLPGKEIFSQQFINIKNSFEKQLDLSALSKGVYFLHVETNKNIINKKVVIH